MKTKLIKILFAAIFMAAFTLGSVAFSQGLDSDGEVDRLTPLETKDF